MSCEWRKVVRIVSWIFGKLNIWLSLTKDEDKESLRVYCSSHYSSCIQLPHTHTHTQVKEIGNFLHSNVLTDLSNQIEQSTEKTMHDFEQSRDDLERHHAKLAQIENEKDQEKRLHKKREWENIFIVSFPCHWHLIWEWDFCHYHIWLFTTQVGVGGTAANWGGVRGWPQAHCGGQLTGCWQIQIWNLKFESVVVILVYVGTVGIFLITISKFHQQRKSY